MEQRKEGMYNKGESVNGYIKRAIDERISLDTTSTLFL